MKYYEDLFWSRFDYLGADTYLIYRFGKEVFDLKQEEINTLKSKVEDLLTELDERNSKDYIISKCEEIIKEILK